VERPVNDGPARCFLAIALPGAVRNTLAAVCREGSKMGLQGSWVREENFHITVRFLGDITENQRTQLGQSLESTLSKGAGLQIQLAGTGVFPNLSRPRVLWAGVTVLKGDLDPIFEAAESAARAIGLPPEKRRPRPHVTLLRLRRTPDASLLKRFLCHTETLTTDAFPVDSVALWKSTLRPGGAVYHKLREF